MQSFKSVFADIPEVMLAYQFCSQVTGNTGPLSDYDFAVYFNPADYTQNTSNQLDFRLKLLSQLAKIIKTDKIDLVVLNDDISPELKFAIIDKGKLIHVVEPYQVLIEPKIINEYIEFKESLRRYDLTKG